MPDSLPSTERINKSMLSANRLFKDKILTYSLFYLLIFIFITSILSVLALITGVFYPLEIGLLGAALSAFIFYFFEDYIGKITINFPKLFFIISVLLVALVFRARPALWILGGQDQGVYTNMSAHFQEKNTLHYEDVFFNTIKDPFLKSLYTDIAIDPMGKMKTFLPGLYFGQNGTYSFQFVHLLPAWMAIFADFFGDTGRFYAIPFFALLSILLLQLLCFELAEHNNIAAFACGLILAVNPLHCFFSKFPVTEIMALTTVSAGIYILLISFRQRDKSMQQILSIFAALFFSLYFFTRISGFMHLPFLLFLFFVSIWLFIRENDNFKGLLYFSALSILLYLISVVYTLKFSSIYANDVYGNVFRVFEAKLGVDISYLLTLVLIILIGGGVYILKFFKGDAARVESFTTKFLGGTALLVLALLALSVFVKPMAYLLEHQGIVVSDDFGKLFFKNTAFNWLLYTSPFLFTATLMSIKKIIHNELLVLGLCFLVVPTIFIAYGMGSTEYQYYYARYLISEVVPFSTVILVAISFLVNTARAKMVRNISIALTIILFTGYSVFQMGRQEAKVAYQKLKDLSEVIEKDDLVLYNATGWENYSVATQKFWQRTSRVHHKIYTPLLLYFNHKVFPVAKNDIIDVTKKFIEGNNKKIGDIYLLSPNSIDSEDYQLQKRIKFYSEELERTSTGIPTEWNNYYGARDIFLYKLQLKRSQRKGFYGDTWSETNASIKYFAFNKNIDKLEIYIEHERPDQRDFSSLGLQLWVNGEQAQLDKYEDKIYYFNLKDTTSVVTEINFKVNPFVPKDAGIGNDTRPLGLSISKILLKKVGNIISEADKKTIQISDAFRRFLNRLPTKEELDRYSSFLRYNSTIDLEVLLLISHEYIASKGKDGLASLIRNGYQDFLGSTPSEEELQLIINKIKIKENWKLWVERVLPNEKLLKK